MERLILGVVKAVEFTIETGGDCIAEVLRCGLVERGTGSALESVYCHNRLPISSRINEFLESRKKGRERFRSAPAT